MLVVLVREEYDRQGANWQSLMVHGNDLSLKSIKTFKS